MPHLQEDYAMTYSSNEYRNSQLNRLQDELDNCRSNQRWAGFILISATAVLYAAIVVGIWLVLSR